VVLIEVFVVGAELSPILRDVYVLELCLVDEGLYLDTVRIGSTQLNIASLEQSMIRIEGAVLS